MGLCHAKLALIICFFTIGMLPCGCQKSGALPEPDNSQTSDTVKQEEPVNSAEIDAQVESHLDQAGELASEGKLTEALQEVEAALALNDRSALAYAQRGFLHMQQGEVLIAHQDLNKAIELEPSCYQAFGYRGALWMRQGEYAQAIDDYTAAIRIAPQHAGLFTVRGNAFFRSGKQESALKDFNTALELDPDDTSALNGRGVLFLQQEQYQMARDDFQHMLELNPMDGGAYMNRGITYSGEGNLKLALADFQKASQILPGNLEAHINLAKVFADLGEYEKAFEEYQIVLKFDPNDTNAIRYSAWFLATTPREELRDGRKAVAMMFDVMKDSTDSDWYDLHVMAAVLAEIGSFEEAIFFQKRAISLAPEPKRELQEELLEVFEAGRPIRHASLSEKQE